MGKKLKCNYGFTNANAKVILQHAKKNALNLLITLNENWIKFKLSVRQHWLIKSNNTKHP